MRTRMTASLARAVTDRLGKEYRVGNDGHSIVTPNIDDNGVYVQDGELLMAMLMEIMRRRYWIKIEADGRGQWGFEVSIAKEFDYEGDPKFALEGFTINSIVVAVADAFAKLPLEEKT